MSRWGRARHRIGLRVTAWFLSIGLVGAGAHATAGAAENPKSLPTIEEFHTSRALTRLPAGLFQMYRDASRTRIYLEFTDPAPDAILVTMLASGVGATNLLTDLDTFDREGTYESKLVRFGATVPTSCSPSPARGIAPIRP